MNADHTIIDKLIAFKQRDKFSTKAWNERGLNPSGDELCRRLTLSFNACADKLIHEVENRNAPGQLKKIMRSGFSQLNKSDYDREEKEFICDLFYELASIVDVDFKDTLNKWLYGSVLTTLMKIQRILRPERIVETLNQPCIQCATPLETHILRKENGIPETSWMVVKCNQCGDLNLLSHGPDIKEYRFENYQWVEGLPMDEYTYEQALIRVEQIRVFRTS